jgi:hypothetical protein
MAAAEPKKVKPICEPEERLRKLLAQTARIELFALILFLTIAVVGVVSCFAELFQLLDNDAIGWIARKAAGGVQVLVRVHHSTENGRGSCPAQAPTGAGS